MFKHMKVGTRLIASFLVISIIGAIVAGLGIYHMAQMNRQAELMYARELVGVSHIKEANINLVYVARAVRNVLLSSDEQQRNAAVADVKGSLRLLETNLDKSRGLFWSDKGKRMLADLDTQLADYKRSVDELLRQATADQLQEERSSVQYMFSTVVPKAKVLDAAMTDVAKLKVDNAAELAASAGRQYADGRLLMIVLVAAGMAAGVVIGVLMTRQLTGQLGGEPAEAAEVAERIANGDLRVQVDLRDGDTSSILFAIKKMRDSLAGIVHEVRSGTDAIATSAGEVAAGSQDLSSRTEQQASSLEETASAMEELTSTVRQNADNANQASTLATTASHTAERGGQVVSEVVTTMGAINDAAHKIVDIIAVIDGIAFQTNILALNAAVEAARAGEQGRGFAVVASEVRNLAQRSANAAKEIKALIDDSVEKVEAGSALVDQAGTTMHEVVSSVKRVSDIVSEITAASSEQTDGIEQINLAITQMDEVTQQNAALVEEAAAASDSLQQQAARLAELVSFFKTEAEAAQRAPAVARPSTKVKAAQVAAQARQAKAPVRSVPKVQQALKRPVMGQQPRPALAAVGGDWEEF